MPSEVIVESCPVTVNYNLSLSEMIAAGKYDWANQSLSSDNFPYSGSGIVKIDLKLVCFRRDTQYADVLAGFEALGMRPGTMPELLALGAEFPNKQLEFPIVQVGTVWHNVNRSGHRGLYLRRGNKERGLAVIWLEHGFLSYYRFIAVPI